MTSDYELLWEDINERVFVADIDNDCWRMYVFPFMGHLKRNSVYVFEKGRAGAYFHKDDLAAEAKVGFSFYANRENTSKALAIIKNEKVVADAFVKKILDIELRKISQCELILLLREYRNVFLTTLGSHYLSQPQIFYDIEKYVLPFVSNNDETFITLTTSARPSALSRCERELCMIALRVLDQEQFVGESYEAIPWLRLELERLADEFGLYAAGQGCEPWSASHYFTELKSFISKGKEFCVSQLILMYTKELELLQKQKDIVETLSSQVQDYIYAMMQLGVYRLDYSRVAWTSVMYAGHKILREIANRAGLTFLQIQNCTFLEIEELLAGNIDAKEFVSELDKREDYFCFVVEGTKKTILSGESARKEALKRVGSFDTSVSFVKGVVANKGHAIGKVRLFSNDFADLNAVIAAFEQGEILVAQNTWPQLMPACKKAAAIVTNEGGVASHGAVVSRELGVPCVVATKIATKIFKTGDLVEVDANNGIVRRVSHEHK